MCFAIFISGPCADKVIYFPLVAVMSTSSKPSPPSAMGITEVWQDEFMLLIPFSAAFPASAEVRQPLNESMAIIIFFIVYLYIVQIY